MKYLLLILASLALGFYLSHLLTKTGQSFSDLVGKKYQALKERVLDIWR